MADYEFKAASRDGYGMDWAVSYADMKPYYDRVESFIGVSARHGRLPAVSRRRVPAADAPELRRKRFSPPAAKSLGWPTTHRRLAQLTRMHNNRPPCHYCGNCVNGCDVGAMFNTVAVTLPPAMKTRQPRSADRLRGRAGAHEQRESCAGVTYIERYTKKSVDVDAKYVILAGSTLENTRLMLLSAKGGLANSSAHPRALHDGPGRRWRRQRHSAETQRRPQPPRRRQVRGNHDPQFRQHRQEDRAEGFHSRLRHERHRRADRVSAVRRARCQATARPGRRK